MAVSIKDVAKEAKVSIATVSRVLNNVDVVNLETQKRVREAIDKLGYRPNIIARSLKTQQTKTIGILIPDISNSLYPEIVRGAEDVSNIYNYNIILCNSDLNIEKEKEYVRVLREKMVDGILLMSNSLERQVIDLVDDLKIKTVLLETKDPCNRFPTVSIDNVEAALTVVNRFVKNGHKKISYIGGSGSILNSASDRYKGYEQGLKDNNLKLDDSIIRFCDPSAKSGYEAMQDVINSKSEFDSVFCTSDEVAMGVINSLRDNGLNVPKDIEVISFNNISMSSVFYPKLTTIDPSSYDVGSIGMRLLLKILAKQEVDVKAYNVSYDLIVRESSK